MNTGNVILLFTLALSMVSLIFLAKSASGDKFSLLTARRVYYLTSLMIFFAALLLMSAFIGNDFQYSYVFNNSAREMSMPYKIAAFWAGNEGSFLLWLFILNICGVLIMRKKDEYENILMTVITMTQIFILLVLIVKSPFAQVWDLFPGELKAGQIPPDGSGMNPLLMDPWMVVHPPVLFLGYATSTIPFGYAIAALLKKDYDKWLSLSYRWLMFSVLTLGVGIFMGGYWAYKVLGWGGYWGWDPVENSSLIPWIVSIALIHGIILQKRKSLLRRTNLFLALSYFILVFYSTFLTRSGVLSDFSVHSFGKSNVSVILATYIFFYIFISAFLFIKRFKEIESARFTEKLLTMENITLYGLITLSIFALIILFGTSMPILSGIFMDNPAGVTEKFYNNLSIPFGLMILTTLIISSFTTSRYSLQVLTSLGILSMAAGIFFNIFFTNNPVAYIFTIPALFLAFINFYDMYKHRKGSFLASRVAHAGLAILIIGVISSNMHSWKEQKKVAVNETIQSGPVKIKLLGFHEHEKSAVAIEIIRGRKTVKADMDYYIEKKGNSLYREPYILSSLAGDIYITPQKYIFASHQYSTMIFKEGEEKKFGGLKVKFSKFRSSGMGSGGMTINADLLINGRKYSPGIKFAMGKNTGIDKKIAGTKRTISIQGIDANKKIIKLHITPEKDAKIPADYAILEISMKRLIWVVWFGTLLISAAFVLTMSNKEEG